MYDFTSINELSISKTSTVARIRSYFIYGKTPLKKVEFFISHILLLTEFKSTCLYTSILYNYFSSCFSTAVEVSPGFDASGSEVSSAFSISWSVFSSGVTFSLLEAAWRSCLIRSSLLACASCSFFCKVSLTFSVVSFNLSQPFLARF